MANSPPATQLVLLIFEEAPQPREIILQAPIIDHALSGAHLLDILTTKCALHVLHSKYLTSPQ